MAQVGDPSTELKEHEWMLRCPGVEYPGTGQYIPMADDTVTTLGAAAWLYLRYIEGIERDIGNLVEHALKYLDIKAEEITGVVPFFRDNNSWRQGESECLAKFARDYFQEQKGHKVDYVSTDYNATVRRGWDHHATGRTGWQQVSFTPEGRYLLFSSTLYPCDTDNAQVIDRIKECKATPLAVCAVIERRKEKGRVTGVPAMYLLDLSEYTFHQDDPEVRKEIEKKGLKTGLHFM